LNGYNIVIALTTQQTPAGRQTPALRVQTKRDSLAFGQLAGRSAAPHAFERGAQLLNSTVRHELTEMAPEGPSVQIRQRWGCWPTPNGARCRNGCSARDAWAKTRWLTDQFTSSPGSVNCDSTMKQASAGASLRQAMSGRFGYRGKTARSGGSMNIAGEGGGSARLLTMALSNARRSGLTS